MKKRGFSIIELIISIGLLSLVLVFMLNLLISMGSKKESLLKHIDLDIDQAVLSKALNTDVLNLNGINKIECSNDTKCEITFNNLMKKSLTITSDKKTVIYKDEYNNEINKKLSKDYEFDKITFEKAKLTNGTFFKLVITVQDYPKYNIEMYSYVLN